MLFGERVVLEKAIVASFFAVDKTVGKNFIVAVGFPPFERVANLSVRGLLTFSLQCEVYMRCDWAFKHFSSAD